MSFDNNNKILGKPEKHLGKARNQGTTENSHAGHCTLTSDRTTVLIMGHFRTCSMNCNYKVAGTLYTLEIWFVSGV
jgi:hypothetical protein